MSHREAALKFHKDHQGKVATELRAPITDKETLGLAYTPGVAQACLEIEKDPQTAYDYTWKSRTIAVISDGTAVLGLGDIGPMASLPVMEGKCNLLKSFGGVDAVPIVLDEKDPEKLIQIIKALAPTFGGINLEDISAPRCIQIERTLIEELDIPVFHDDQHGTAIVVTAGLINALKLIGKSFEALKVVVSGVGAAGSSIIRMLYQVGVRDIYGFNRNGVLNRDKLEQADFLQKELIEITNPSNEDVTLEQAMVKADVFIGVSAGNIVSEAMVASMNENAVVFALANPEPEITYELAKKAGARVVGTGRSDAPNQVNNVLVFPGLFKGALASRATKITDEMKLAAAYGLASLITENQLNEEYVIPEVFDSRVADVVAKAVMDEVERQQTQN